MPFALDPEDCWRPRKRRRIAEWASMARRRRNGDVSLESREQHDIPAETQAQPSNISSRSKSQVVTSDREELIQCIKRGQRPTWVPKPNLEALCVEADAQAQARMSNNPAVMPAANVGNAAFGRTSFEDQQLPESQSAIAKRPPSASHSGDFRESDKHHENHSRNPLRPRPSTPPTGTGKGSSPSSWSIPSPHSHFVRTTSDPVGFSTSPIDTALRSRATSLGSSASSSFVMRAPTSPLVHAINAPSTEFKEPRMPYARSLTYSDRSERRKTMPPETMASLRSSLRDVDSSSETSMPYRSHQTRRSLSSFTYQPALSSQTVFPSRQRRLSHTMDSSPQLRNSMVGSFEESILRGRMSTAPSKPLEFVAQIGVLGKGDCPAKLKCPPHVSVPFPAVFYSYPSAGDSRTISDDSPSPYVGTIDLAKHLKVVDEPIKKRRRATTNDPEALIAQITGPENTSIGRALAAQAEARQEEPSDPRKSLGGAYRVPQQGQLQVIIKNPNNTAVKLFLIPYDLEGMHSGCKTFVRQRSFSSGPIVENVISEKPIRDPLSDRHLLRYLIHLKFCCLGKGRLYLYDSIRVVFANRVPDGKEKLRNEVQLPDPKFSALTLNAGSMSRRQSGVESFYSPSSANSPRALDLRDGLPIDREGPNAYQALASAHDPFKLSPRMDKRSEQYEREECASGTSTSQQPSSRINNGFTRPQSPEVHGFDRSSTSQRGSPVPWGSYISLPGARSPSPSTLQSGNGLLSKKLRELDQLSGKPTPRGSAESLQDTTSDSNL